MPKRRNPFGECSPMQLKQHVGRKEVDLGVAQGQHMKDVYSRTKELLFSGSKKSFEMPVDANCNNIYKFTPSLDVPMEDDSSQTTGQLQISQTGHLTNPITENNNKPTNAFHALFMGRKAPSSVSSCQCCKGQAASQDRCGFCEKSICYDCVRSCSSCDGHFCELCSVMNPEDPVQQWLCQQCSYRYEDITSRSYCLNCAS